MENYHTDDYKFKGQDGLFIAAALTMYNTDTEILEDKSYGELTIEHFGWGNSEANIVDTEPLDFHYCSDEELGITRTAETVVYPWFERIETEVMTYRKKFKCISKEDTVIWGDYNSAKTQQLAIRFRMCEGGEANGCKKEEEIRDWLRRKYIVLMYNHKRFETDQYFEDSVVKESHLIYVPISSQTR